MRPGFRFEDTLTTTVQFYRQSHIDSTSEIAGRSHDPAGSQKGWSRSQSAGLCGAAWLGTRRAQVRQETTSGEDRPDATPPKGSA